MIKAMTFSNWNTSFLLERVAALRIVPKFDRKSNTRNMGFSDSIRVKVIVTQNIPTVTELLRRENTSITVLFMRKSTVILVFFDSAAIDRCSALIGDVNDSTAGEADC